MVVSVNIAIAINSITITIASILYSANKNALAPSLILAEISFILSVPSSSFDTSDVKINANTNANIATTIAIINGNLIVSNDTLTPSKLKIFIFPPNTKTRGKHLALLYYKLL